MNKALVFNCDYNGLGVIQNLGRHGVQILALDSVRSAGTWSRYAKYRSCPNPMVAEKGFIDTLLRLGPSFDEKPVLFPTNDHWAVAVARAKERLARYYIPCVVDNSVMELVIEKHRFYDWALSRNLPVPRSWPSDRLDAIPDEAFPLAAKPKSRRTASDDAQARQRARQLDGLRLTILRNRADLDRFTWQHRDLLSYFLFQEYVEGMSDRMYTVGVYANRDHEVMGLFSGRKVRGFPPDIGDCIVGQVETVPVYLKELVVRLCREIQYHGIAEFEFKRDAVTQEFKLIEINPRSWSWVGITEACGVGLPWLAYRDLTGRALPDCTGSELPDGSVKWVKLFADLSNCLRRNRRVGYPQWHMTLRQWRRSLKCRRLVVAELSWDDPVPGLYSICNFMRTIWAGGCRALRRLLGRNERHIEGE